MLPGVFTCHKVRDKNTRPHEHRVNTFSFWAVIDERVSPPRNLCVTRRWYLSGWSESKGWGPEAMYASKTVEASRPTARLREGSIISEDRRATILRQVVVHCRTLSLLPLQLQPEAKLDLDRVAALNLPVCVRSAPKINLTRGQITKTPL